MPFIIKLIKTHILKLILITLVISLLVKETKHFTSVTLNERPILNYEYFAKSLNCKNKSSYQNPAFKKEAQAFLSNEHIIARCSDCSSYFDIINSNGFDPPTPEEKEWPLAFAYTVHKQIGILEMFLALYFRPTDAHCIHVDAKAKPEIFKTVLGIVQCYNKVFPQSLVFMPRQSIPVFWGAGGSMMEADAICYRELMARSKKWKYVGNIAGTELPFVSIQRFRQKLRRLGGNSMAIARNNDPSRLEKIYDTLR